MGEARRRDLSDKARAFAKTDRCIFCGGMVEATTIDHCPPQAIFDSRKHPEGYVFPACVSCNAGSRVADNWVALLSRIHSVVPMDDEKSRAVFERLARPLMKPDVIKAMELSANKKRNLARRVGLQLAPGETYAELGLMTVPPAASEAVGVFAAKIGKALHFMHSGRIVPVQAAIEHRWFTNYNYAEGRIPDEVFTIPANGAVLQSARVDLSDQFNYRYALSDDGELSMFTLWFRLSFCVVVAITFDPLVMVRVIGDAGTRAEARQRGKHAGDARGAEDVLSSAGAAPTA